MAPWFGKALALVSLASADETCTSGSNCEEMSLMQDLIKRGASRQKLSLGDVDLKSTEGRRDSMSKLLETATHMLKNGATPAVLEFVQETTREIVNDVLPAIESEHEWAQKLINDTLQEFHDARNALEARRESINNLGAERHANIASLKECRAQESVKCAQARQCNSELMRRWHEYEAAEHKMRGHHEAIHHEWCVPLAEDAILYPSQENPGDSLASFQAFLSRSDHFTWDETNGHPHSVTETVVNGETVVTVSGRIPGVFPGQFSIVPYPAADIPENIQQFRSFSQTEFTEYIAQKPRVEEAWTLYQEKLTECALASDELETKTNACDLEQDTVEGSVCTHALDAREARREFGEEWANVGFAYRTARESIEKEEIDRIHEWQNLHIVMCLLDTVGEHVSESIALDTPCITETSDPNRTHYEIENCHAVIENLTRHLIIDYGVIPEMPPLPDIHNVACTAEYVWEEQGSNSAEVGSTLDVFHGFYASPGDAHAHEAHGAHHLSHNVEVTPISAMGWGSCAAPKVCNDHLCRALRPQEPDLAMEGETHHDCRAHETHLVLGELADRTFRCLDGQCVAAAARCNGHSNCADNSDEEGCTPEVADLTRASTCPAEINPFITFQCTDGSCISKGARCNGVYNCADESDEAGCQCSTLTGVTVEATSGRTASVETYSENMMAFHDRSYTLSGGTEFSQGKTMIKFSNADKSTPADHVMLKINVDVPVNVWIMKFEDQTLDWLTGSESGWTHRTDLAGVVVSHQSGVRYGEYDSSPQRTWVQWSAVEGEEWASSPAQVYTKTFPAGTISLHGNGHNDGSYLVFLDAKSCAEHALD